MLYTIAHREGIILSLARWAVLPHLLPGVEVLAAAATRPDLSVIGGESVIFCSIVDHPDAIVLLAGMLAVVPRSAWLVGGRRWHDRWADG